MNWYLCLAELTLGVPVLSSRTQSLVQLPNHLVVDLICNLRPNNTPDENRRRKKTLKIKRVTIVQVMMI